MKTKSLNEKTNTYVLRRFDGVMLIDPFLSYEEIIELTKGLKIWGILLTNAFVGNLNLINRINAPVYLHKDDYFLFVDQYKDEKENYNLNKVDLKLIDGKSKIKFVDEEVEVIHTPGYTKGSVCYYFNEILYTGNTITINGPGFIKGISHSDYLLKKSIKQLYERFKITTTVSPGQGKVTTLLEIRQNSSKVRTILK